MIKVYVADSGRHFPTIHDSVAVDHPSKANVIVFMGGTDINTDIYGERQGRHTQNPNNERDLYELGLLLQYPNALKFGICRGHQLLGAFNGAKLIQHCRGHHKNHKIYTQDDEYPIVTTTSCHHQMINNNSLLVPHEILAYSVGISDIYLNEYDQEIGGIQQENEAIWFPETKCLSVQGHPEWMAVDSDYVKLINKWINNYLFD